LVTRGSPRKTAHARTHRVVAVAPPFTGSCATSGLFGDDAPAMLRGLRTRGQQTPEELIDRYRLVPRPDP